eukprot:scaffold34214_cov63-Phaeocystis_antarctica.AAC.1
MKPSPFLSKERKRSRGTGERDAPEADLQLTVGARARAHARTCVCAYPGVRGVGALEPRCGGAEETGAGRWQGGGS